MKKFFSMLLTATLILLSAPTFAHTGEAHMWDGKKSPTLKLIITKDPMSGFNVQIKTKNFKWSPQRASMAHKPGEGHAHIYIDDVKVGRVYGEWYHLATANLNLSPGSHVVRVDLNGNDHAPYMFKGKLLEARQTINI